VPRRNKYYTLSFLEGKWGFLLLNLLSLLSFEYFFFKTKLIMTIVIFIGFGKRIDIMWMDEWMWGCLVGVLCFVGSDSRKGGCAD